MKQFNLSKLILNFATLTLSVITLLTPITVQGSTEAVVEQTQSSAEDAVGHERIAAEDNTEQAHESTEAGTHQEDEGIVGLFGLNWKLFVAQLINFSIVLFVLWKWVFGPVTKGLSDRTSKIESSLKEAEQINEDRQNFDSWKENEVSQVRKEASAIILQAKQDAEQLKNHSLETTKQEQDKLREQAIAQIEQEKNKAIVEVQSHLADLVTQASEKIIQTNLDPKTSSKQIQDAINQAKE
ncbi:MAG: F0F1 ATP synthase subunit B [Candidatus Doudnabacteria bacterium]